MPQRLFPLSSLTVALLCAFNPVAHAEPAPSGAGEDARSLAPVTVTASADASAEGLQPAYAGGQVARGGKVGMLGQQDFLETPFNLTSYTQELIQNQQAASVGEVLLNDPAVRVARGFGNFQQLYLVRGLPIYSDDMSYNGLYGLLPRQYLATELIERVEVLRGANAFLNGAAPGGSGLGGAVNVMPKRAGNEALSQLTTGVQSGGQVYMAGDLARRFADDRFGVRINAARRDGDTAVDRESGSLSVVSVGTDFRSGDLRISADFGYQDHRMKASQPSVTIGAGLAIPDAPEASHSLAQPWTYSNETDSFGTLRAEYDIGRGLTGWIAAGMRESKEEASFANPTMTRSDGTTTAYRFDNLRKDSVATGEFGLRSTFASGGVHHVLSLSGSVFHQDSRNAYAFSNFAGFGGNLYAPAEVVAPATDFYTGGTFSDPHVTEKVQTASVALADVISLLDDRLRLTLGARHQSIKNYGYDYNSGAETSGYSKSAVTPVGGIVYTLMPGLSAYANYIEGLVKGDTAPASSGTTVVVNAGEVLSPYKTRQTEIGMKFDGGRIGGTLSLYQSRKPGAGTDSDGVFRVLSHQRNRGLELSAYGEATRNLKVLGGISLLDTDSAGKNAIGAPESQANLGLEWSVAQVHGLSFESRVIYTSAQYADAANTQELPSWTRLDLGVRYVMPAGAQMLTLRGRIDNVTDSNYWASAGGYPGAGYLTLGAPRTYIVSASLDF